MRQLLELMLFRPLSAFLSSAELLNRKVSGAQMIDGMLSRMVHTLSSPYVNPDRRRGPPDQSRGAIAPDDIGATAKTTAAAWGKEAM